MVKKLIALTLALLFVPNAFSGPMVEALQAAIATSDTVKVQYLLAHGDFSADELTDAYAKAREVYENNNTAAARLGQVLLKPARTVALAYAVHKGLDMLSLYKQLLGYEAPYKARDSQYSAEIKATESRLDGLKKELTALQASKPAGQSESWWKSLFARKDALAIAKEQEIVNETRTLSDLKAQRQINMRSKERFERINLSELKGTLKCTVLSLAIGTGAVYWLATARSAHKDAATIVAYLEAALVRKNRTL